MFETMMKNVKVENPLIHCITNYVTVNDCANILLAANASPIMADDEMEVEEVTSICNGLNINIGTLNQRTIKSMIKAGKKANELNHPVSLDPVGMGVSQLRTNCVYELLDQLHFSVIKGNVSEIKAIYEGHGLARGVDANEQIDQNNLDDLIVLAKQMAKRYESIIVITGKIDIVANEKKAYLIYNGRSLMSKVTGTGCMLSALINAYLSANSHSPLEAVMCAVCLMGYCGEKAYDQIKQENKGTSSYKTYLIDAISLVDSKELVQGAKYEIR